MGPISNPDMTSFVEQVTSTVPEDSMAQLERRLKALKLNRREFLVRKNPLTSAVWLALMRDADALITEFKLRTVGEVTHSEPLLGEDDAAPPQKPAIVALGETIVAQALLGSVAAQNLISERIEGKVGTRRGETDDPNQMRDVVQMIEGIVKSLTEKRAERGDDHIDAATIGERKEKLPEQRLTHAQTEVPHVDHTRPEASHVETGPEASNSDPVDDLRRRIEQVTRR